MLNLALFLVILLTLGILFDRYLVDVLPVAFCLLIGILFILSFFNALNYIEILFTVICMVMIVLIYKKNIRMCEVRAYIKKQFSNPAIYS